MLACRTQQAIPDPHLSVRGDRYIAHVAKGLIRRVTRRAPGRNPR